jgi:tetratricopeptide (TPR) repeat protein
LRSSERHQLKQDQFAVATTETLDWAAEHRNTLIFGGSAVVVVLLLLIGGFYYQSNRQQKASVLLGEALVQYQAPIVAAGTTIPQGQVAFYNAADRAKAASNKLVEVSKNYGHTDSATLANYFLGLCAEDMGDNAKAEQYLKDVADSGNKDIAALAKSALATLYRDTARDQQAIAVYKQLIEKPTNTVPKASAQLALADLYATIDASQARRLYDEVSKENPNNGIGGIASARMAALK